ncbi:hypothetical protein SAMN06265377_2134 [Flagellimonas pacifica]|uniref:Uncharacterized protein n=1 Tax=Flagellimonas pacifica TaxID=1247520 RepID=A0A285MT02_9FLAO|nr:hypothetical protein SAMN06265377_2134 [Allomuricauda parva]
MSIFLDKLSLKIIFAKNLKSNRYYVLDIRISFIFK